MPLQPAGIEVDELDGRRRTAGLPQSQRVPLPKLHHMPLESPRKLRRQEPPAMKILISLLLALPLLAQTPAPAPPPPAADAAKPADTAKPDAAKPADAPPP